MNAVSVVANLQKAHDYYKEQLEEAKGIIKQLVEGPGEIEYINPFDLAEKAQTDVFVISGVGGNPDKNIIADFHTGKKYKQSILIPAKTKNIS
jgi:hypothetical protein